MTGRFTLRRHTLLACFSGLFLLLVNPTFGWPRGDDTPAGLAPEKLARIPALLQEAVEKKQIAGGSALIAKNGKLVYFKAVGMQDIENKVLLSESTIFRIASMSKPITSIAVMVLVEEGKLSVTDPLSKFVPEFKAMHVMVPAKDGKSFTTVKANREITIHDLLTHTSGLSYRLFDKPFISKMYAEAGVSDGISETQGTLADNVRKLAKLPLVCQPGTSFEYGLNTDVLGHVIEVVSGKPLEEFCRERIFGPLKMLDTCFVLPKEKHARLSALYAANPADKSLTRVGAEPVTAGGFVYSATYSTREGYTYYSGGGGMVSTAGDYFRFCQMLLNRGELDGVRVLKPETVDRVLKNQLGDAPLTFPMGGAFGYGFGLVTEKSREQSKDPAAVGTYSWAGAFNTFFWVDPKNQLIGVIMTQVFPASFDLAIEFKKLTYEALTDAKK